MSSARRLLPLTIGILVVAIIAFAVAMQFIGGSEVGDDESTAPGSVTNEDDSGASAWYAVLGELGYEVDERRSAFDDADDHLPETGTLITVAPNDVSGDELDAIEHWLATGSGRRLVVVEPTGGALGLIQASCGALPGCPRVDMVDTEMAIRPVAPAPETAGISQVGPAASSFFEMSEALVLYGLDADPSRAFAVRYSPPGSTNTVIAVAESLPVLNEEIVVADNAAFAVAIAGPKDQPIFFDQFHHLPHKRPGVFGFLPGPVQWFLLQVIVAGVVWAISLAFGFGPPLPEPITPPRRRIEYVNALANAYEEADATGEALELLRFEIRDLLRHRLRASYEASDSDLIARAPEVGVPSDHAASVLEASLDSTLSFTEVAQIAAEIRRRLDTGAIHATA